MKITTKHITKKNGDGGYRAYGPGGAKTSHLYPTAYGARMALRDKLLGR